MSKLAVWPMQTTKTEKLNAKYIDRTSLESAMLKLFQALNKLLQI